MNKIPIKHELVSCERCENLFECKSNSSIYCQCNQIELSLNESEYISSLFDNCLCLSCLAVLKEEYQS